MIKYIATLLFIFPFTMNAKCADESDIVFYHDENGQHQHIAWYKPCCYIVTIMEGPNKGLQQLLYGQQILVSSKDSEIHNTYFIHFYDGFKVYSWDDYQRIVYTKEDMQCLEQRNDTSK
jgi:hypothetical protein